MSAHLPTWVCSTPRPIATEKLSRSIKRALRVSPQLREIQLDLGLAYLKQEDYVHALPYFRQLHARSPSDPQATMLLATCLTFSGHPDQGLSFVEAVDRTAEDADPAALYLLGVAYARAGQAQAAQDVFTKLFADSATPAQANFLLGQAYYDAAQFHEAEQAYQAVLQADPSFARRSSRAGQGLHQPAEKRRCRKAAEAGD